ncbi:unnamed protein product [Paramecium octaurelia]|uniref:Uncharacterized protein n=1 Tax=Paramecium octaurelia TaxID=43137 RepID=A0A8S1SQJ2_PAROT|nr:unnamed protein product [Paramecium octaurelia]
MIHTQLRPNFQFFRIYEDINSIYKLTDYNTTELDTILIIWLKVCHCLIKESNQKLKPPGEFAND